MKNVSKPSWSRLAIQSVAACSLALAGAAYAQVPSATGTGVLSNTTTVQGAVSSYAPGQSYSGASATQSSSFTLQPASTTNTFASTQLGLTGTTQTQGSALAFNTSVGGAMGSASAGGSNSSTVNGTLNFPSAHGTGTGTATSSTLNAVSVGANEAQSNASVSGSNFYVSIQQDAGYGPTYNGLTLTNTTTAGGSAYVDSIAATGVTALTNANVNLANIPNVGNLAQGATFNETSGLTNSPANTAIANASFNATVTASNNSGSQFNYTAPVPTN